MINEKCRSCSAGFRILLSRCEDVIASYIVSLIHSICDNIIKVKGNIYIFCRETVLGNDLSLAPTLLALNSAERQL
jgi:hypothetical protein